MFKKKKEVVSSTEKIIVEILKPANNKPLISDIDPDDPQSNFSLGLVIISGVNGIEEGDKLWFTLDGSPEILFIKDNPIYLMIESKDILFQEREL